MRRSTPPVPSRRLGALPVAIPVALALSLGMVGARPALAGPQERAEALQARGDLRAAQLEWRNAVREQPQSPTAHASLAATSLELGDAEMAEREARAALANGYDQQAGTSLLMRAYLISGRFEALLRDFPQQETPPALGALIAATRGRAQLALRQNAEAEQSIALAQRLAPELPDVGNAVADLALIRGDRAAAEAAVDAVLARNPNDVEALVRKGRLQFEQHDPQAAVASFSRLLDQAPGNVSARLRRAEALMQLRQDDKARVDVDAALAVLPGSIPAIYLRGLIKVRAQDWAGADEDFQKIGAALTNFPEGYLMQATVKRGLGQMAQAEDAASRYVARQPEDPRGARLLATLALEGKRPQEAADVLSRLAARGKADAPALDLLGRVQASLKRPREAVDALQKAAALAPNDAGIQSRLAAARLQVGDASGTAAAAERALQLGPDNAPARQMLAYSAMFRGDLEAAEAELKKLPPEAQKNEAGLVLQGTVETIRMNLPAARAAFEAALKQKPDSNAARMGLVRVAMLQNAPAEAERLLGEVLRQEPGHAEALAQLTTAASPGAPRAAEARAVLEAAQAAAPGEPRLALALGTVLVRSGEAAKAASILDADQLKSVPGLAMPRSEANAAAGNWAEAEAASRQALAENPNSSAARRQLAMLLLRGGDARAAESLIREGLRSQPADSTLQLTLAGILLQSQGVEAGLAEAEKLSRQASAQPASRSLPGDVLAFSKRPEEAARAYAAASKEAPSSALALREAASWRAAGKPDQATAALRTWLAQQPEDPEALVMLSQLSIEAGRLDEAEQQLSTVAAKRPQDPVVLNNLAWVLGRHNTPDGLAKAEEVAERAYFISPNAETADTLGWILARNGQADRAVPLLRRSVTAKGKTPDPSATFRLAYALRATGAKQEALDLLTPVMASNPTFPERAEANRLLAELRAAR